jgi:hypothetical protein
VDQRFLELKDLNALNDLFVNSTVKVTFPASFSSAVAKLTAQKYNDNTKIELNVANLASNASSCDLVLQAAQQGQSGLFPNGANIVSISIYALTYDPSFTTILSSDLIEVTDLPEPIEFTLTITGTGISDLTALRQRIAAFGGNTPLCQYFDTQSSMWMTSGVSTTSTVQGSGVTNGTGVGTLYTIRCSTTHLTSFGSFRFIFFFHCRIIFFIMDGIRMQS